jgi:hypothetical protein
MLNIPQKIYTVYSKTHEVFKPWFETVFNVYPNIKIEYALIEQVCSSGRNYDSGWTEATIQKLEKIINFFDDPENTQDFFIYSDVDIQFFNPFHEEIYEKLKDNDMAFQDDGPFSVCTGFFACKKTHKCKSFFIHVLDELKKVQKTKPDCFQSHADDQRMTQYCLNKNVDIKYTKLSHNYFNFRHSFNWGINGSKKLWEPYENIAIPPNIYLHHANWTKGIENKILLLEHISIKAFNNRLKEESNPSSFDERV